ncbi:beta-fructofuranosidase [Enterococcus sp. JM4C]|uniref:glycoside hydrolase family 32 protein n=1 Tax=Candidatus Enterococcus huntleyi TaxID=1857217 RepID=UPI001379DE75|nr:glycoside hydrolase family 32 protein [Enterococcus sp. JM4C]KAF1296181.1 beta-fructofuranosidase [Enterococcus sp. JM4C]
MTVDKWILENQELVNPLYKPRQHFSAPIGWINDPNGFVYYKGEYHLFYQHHPYSAKWGPMHWGHAKSRDLLNWEHLPEALTPDMPYDEGGCFSGTALVEGDKLILMYTGVSEVNGKTRQIQCLATSTDGITFEKSSHNPVIDERQSKNTTDFRDPKLFKKNDKYYSLVASTDEGIGNVLLFESTDLENWKFTSVFLTAEAQQGKIWECPDLFELDGKEVLIVSPIAFTPDGHRYTNVNSSVYFVGHVDWEQGTFIAESYDEIDSGLDFYAPQTLEDAQGRRIMIAWEQMWGRNIPSDDLGHRWAGSMIIPRELRLVDGKLRQTVISEYQKSVKLVSSQQVDQDYRGQLESLTQVETKQPFSIELGGADDYLDFRYDGELLTVDRTHLKQVIEGEEASSDKRSRACSFADLTVKIYVDKACCEIIVNDEITFSTTFYLETETPEIRIKGNELKVEQYRSI